MARLLRWRAPATGLAALVLFLLLGWDTFAGATAGTHERGRAIYNFRCYFCHGYAGDAQTLAASMLSPPPRDFTAGGLDAAAVERAVRHGVPGTAMQSFANVLDDAEQRAVAAFVVQEFVRDRAPNTRYHTADNGWPDHERHAAAFPFARGTLALDTPEAQLDDTQRAGRALYLQACVSCHDRGRHTDPGPAWATRPLSYPRLGFQPGEPNLPPVDAVSSASVYAKHEVAPRIAGLTPQQRRGEQLFHDNCAFCHGGDGSGRNWIGQFMEPHARDLTQYDSAAMPEALLKQRIREGLPGTSMPAWAAVLPPRDIDAVAAYVQRAFFRAPALQLPDLQHPASPLDLSRVSGRPWLLHAWASWCGPCRRGHGALRDVAALAGLPLVGVAVRDDARDAQEWLLAQGDPFTLSGLDGDGRALAPFGLAGLPGTLLLDGAGRLVHRHDGPLTPEVWRAEFAPRLAALQAASSSASNSASGSGGANR